MGDGRFRLDVLGRPATRLAVVLLTALGVPATTPDVAWAQPAAARWFVGADVGVQTTSLADWATEPIAFERFAEQGGLTRRQTIGRRPTITVAGGVRLWRTLGVRAGFLQFTREDDAHVSLSIPHPFFFDRPRRFEQDTTVELRERSVDLHGYWSWALGHRVELQVFGGPTFYDVTIEVAGITVGDEVFPFEESPVTRTAVVERQATQWGWAAGVDLSVFLTRHIGLGWLTRFSRASADIVVSPSGAFFDEVLEAPLSDRVEFGGALVSAGVRFRF